MWVGVCGKRQTAAEMLRKKAKKIGMRQPKPDPPWQKKIVFFSAIVLSGQHRTQTFFTSKLKKPKI